MSEENNITTKENERNTVWRVIMTVTSLVLIGIVVFFLVKMFTGNPLEGTWINEDSGMILSIKGDDTAVVSWPEEYEGVDSSVTMTYSIDLGTKTFTLRASEVEVQETVEAAGGRIDESSLDQAVSNMEATYDYNMEQNQLTLTDREYGDQMVFDKK